MTIFTRGLLIDLDDTLYTYAPAERAARAAVIAAIATGTFIPTETVDAAWIAARDAVHARLGPRGSAHSRLLYLTELVHRLGCPGALSSVRRWERTFWRTFLDHAQIKAGSLDLLGWWRGSGGRVAIVTDLTLEIQLWKLEHFGLIEHIDALVTSEEVNFEKPCPDALLLALERLGVRREDSVMVGDSEAKDGGAAYALGIPFIKVDRSVPDLHAVRETLGQWCQSKGYKR